MKKIQLYYFSGTGNSLAVAKDISERLGAEIISIPQIVKKDIIEPEADIIGIIFPVYLSPLGGMPNVVREFVNRLANINDKYIFAVCTHKGGPFKTTINLARMIKKKGGKLACGFTVHMPGNEEKLKEEEKNRRLNSWKNNKLDKIINYISTGKSGRFETNGAILEFILMPWIASLEKESIDFLKKMSGKSENTFEELIPESDNKFTVNDKCNGCGTCEKVCPKGNIKITNGKPTWRNHCELCLACYNWCPQNAIQHDIIKSEGFQYHHPEIKLSEFTKKI